MKSLVCVLLLVFVLVEVLMCCEGCWKQEREALIALNSQLENSLSWVDNNPDCCQWYGVECNTATGRVAKLKLRSHIIDPWHLNYSDFLIFEDLKTLDLSSIRISNCIRTDQGLKNLEVLDLSNNEGLNNATNILSCLDRLSSLKSLLLFQLFDTTSSQVFQTVFEALSSKLLHLEILHIGFNNLTNEILPSLGGFRSLKELYLPDIGLESDLHFQRLYTLKNLEILDISVNNFKDTDIASALSGLSSLKSLNLQYSKITPRSIHNISKLRSLEILDLTGNNLKSWPPTPENRGFAWSSSLQILVLRENRLNNNILSSISNLPCLKSLDLGLNKMKGSLDITDHFSEWSKLKKLEKLDLSFNEFVGKLPSSFVNMTSLRTLVLTENHFTGNIGPNLASFTSLEYLDFEGNQFEFPISFTQFSNHSNIKFIYGNGNKVILDSHSTMKTWIPKFQLDVLQLSSITHANSIPLPNFLLYQYHLTYVDFSGCKLRGEFPNWLLKNNTKMEHLILQNCSLIGNFELPSRPYLNMITVDVSNNAITGQMLSNNISSIFPNLNYLDMSRNAIHGSIPCELGRLSSLQQLDLSNNQLSGGIPYNLSRERSEFTFLGFSNNKLHGNIPPMLSMFSPLRYLLLDGNNLSGSIPSNFFNSISIQYLDISNNNFIGKIPSQIRKLENLVELSMSNNHFEGSIPTALAELGNLIYLDLSQNNLSGCVPSFVKSSAAFVHLNNNNLSCLSKNMFGERTSIVTLDLSNNEIINGFHGLIHDLCNARLKILLMKGNHFTGNIPKKLCQLVNLNILDLSYNKFVGEIPSCLGKMPFENKDPDESREQFNGVIYSDHRDTNFPFGEEKDNFTSKKRLETYTTNILIYMSGIDLSHNKLNGSIPSELGNLTRIRALNLSNNLLTEKIPDTFSNLVQVESLDLSFNMLSGRIPPQLTGLTSLEVFSVAHNNLSGATPERKGQFITFEESSYEGNQFLCGPPLPKICNPSGQAPNDLNKDGDDDSWVDMYVFRVSFVVAYTSILLVIAIVLYINPYWRQTWFYYIGLIGMNCYYFIEDNLYKFF